jgi:hypothetical protein
VETHLLRRHGGLPFGNRSHGSDGSRRHDRSNDGRWDNYGSPCSLGLALLGEDVIDAPLAQDVGGLEEVLHERRNRLVLGSGIQSEGGQPLPHLVRGVRELRSEELGPAEIQVVARQKRKLGNS